MATPEPEAVPGDAIARPINGIIRVTRHRRKWVRAGLTRSKWVIAPKAARVARCGRGRSQTRSSWLERAGRAGIPDSPYRLPSPGRPARFSAPSRRCVPIV